MKKRMFITTIVMMLVLAIALTTSSLAWFSSANTSVTAAAASFSAKSSQSNEVNLKISNQKGTWGNEIALTDGGTRTMVGLIPTTPLVATLDTSYSPNYVQNIVNGVSKNFEHGAFVWPRTIEFNAAKIGDEDNFIIGATAAGKTENGEDATADALKNKVEDYKNLEVDSSAGYYYDEFYIHNADAEQSIAQLTFKIVPAMDGNTPKPIIKTSNTETGDYTCNAYAAFILYDEVEVTGAAGTAMPVNALENTTGSSVTTSENQKVWVPFAAFTIAIDKSGMTAGQNNVNQGWQFGDLDSINAGAFVYSSVDINQVDRQMYDALSGASNGFVLKASTLQALNNKVVKTKDPTTYVSVDNSNTARDVTIANTQTQSNFNMVAGETFKVAFYVWLDGYSMTSFTDTTVIELGIEISGSKTAS